ncbi:MAG: restriction endonuclease subunit S [Desulfobacterales bacterium]
MNWRMVQFEQLYAEPSRNGVYKPKEHHGTGVKIVNMGELFAYDVIGGQEMKRLRMSGAELSKSGLEDGDLLFGRRSLVEAGAGKCSIVEGLEEPTTFESSLIRVRVDQTQVRPRFIFYWLKSPQGGGRVRAIVTGTNVKGIRSTVLKTIQVACPPINIQDAIVSKLRAYDDLIENNRRRIQLLEQAARLLFKEWFVRFRFPRHEHTKIIGGMPEGWEEVTISSFCIVGRGGSPRPIKDFLGGTVSWFKIGDATASESPFVFVTAEAIIESGVKKSVLLPQKELILSNSATCGIPYFTGKKGCIHDGWLYFKNLKRVSKWFLYCCLYEKQRAILAGIGEGATQKNLNADYIGRQHVLIPKSTSLIDHFDSVAEPIFRQVFTLAQANMMLRQARDLLLPKLMNGEVAV